MDIKNEEELNPEESSEETSTEETKEGNPEESSTEENSEEDNKKVPSEEEYTKERFDGMMSSWQKDRQRMLQLEEEIDKIKSSNATSEQKQEWLYQLDEMLEGIRKEKEEKELTANRREKDEVLASYPALDINKVVDLAGEHGISLMQAAGILKKIQTESGIVQKKTLSEAERKKQAGAIGGGSGAVGKGKFKYDSNKSFEENFEEGLKEFGG